MECENEDETTWLPNTPRSTDGGPKGSLGTTTGDEREWYLDKDRPGFLECLQLSGTLLPLGNPQRSRGPGRRFS